jgi:hypothetical protein
MGSQLTTTLADPKSTRASPKEPGQAAAVLYATLRPFGVQAGMLRDAARAQARFARNGAIIRKEAHQSQR